jgi:hypothetical protein
MSKNVQRRNGIKADGQSFLPYVKQIAAPTFKRRDIVVMDKVRVSSCFISRRTALTSIQSSNSSPNQSGAARSGSALNRGLVVGRRLLPRGISPRECAAYLANAGYGQPCRKMR